MIDYKQEILDNFSQGNFKIPSYDNNAKRVIILSGDPGFDGSDVLEYIASFSRFSNPNDVIICVTSLWHPNEKAKILDSIATNMHIKNVHIISGYGCYEGKESKCLEKFPAWPVKSFGDPLVVNQPLDLITHDSYKGVYNAQINAYHTIITDNVFPEVDVVESIKTILRPFNEQYNIEIFATGPVRDVANILEDKDLSSKVTVIRGVMGGGFGSFGNEKRFGYNFAIDPEGTKKFIEAIKINNIPTIVVTSQLCSTIEIKTQDFSRLIDWKGKSPLHEAITEGWKNWNKNMSLKRNSEAKDFNIADLLTSSVLQYPEFITQYIRGYYTIYPEKIVEQNINMLSPNANILFDSFVDDDSSIFFITGLDGSIYDLIMKEVSNVLVGNINNSVSDEL